MKLIILLAVAAVCHGAKLDRTYLPPNAQSSGGSGSFLQGPLAGPASNGNGFGQNGNDYSQNANGFSQNGNFGRSGNGFAQNGNGFAQNANEFAQNNNGFAQNGNDFAQNSNDYAQTANQEYNNVNGFENFESRPERPQAAFERNAAILRLDNKNDGESYSYAYETENGIYAEENGVATNGVEAQGGYSYTGDDGQVYSVRYTADQNGFVPQGDHLPTPPPVPEEILKALEQNARDEAAGIYDDGSYNEAKYGDNQQFDNAANFNYGNQYEGANANNDLRNFNGDEDTIVTDSADFRTGNGFGNQGVRAQGNGENGQNGVEKAYLPPFANQNGSFGSQRAVPQESFGQRQAGRAQGSFEQNQGSNGVNKAYLPPFRGGARSSSRQPGRNGYQY